MFEVQILIPVTDNDGASFPESHFAVFAAHIGALFGSYSLLPGTVIGHWTNEAGVVFTDESRVYMVAIVSLTDGGKVGALVAFAKVHFAQEKIAIRYLGLFEAI